MVHELGHFLVAKKFGIQVLEFGFGLPPRAWSKKIGETIFSVNWLPVGGFVRLLGDDEVDKKILSDKKSFAAAKVWKRILVVVAGVVMNLFLSWIIFYGLIFANNFKILIPAPTDLVIVQKVEHGSPASTAGLLAQDRILAVSGQSVTDGNDFITKIKRNSGKETTITVSNWEGGNKREVVVLPRENPPAGQGPIGVVTSPFAFREFKSIPEKIFSAPIYSFELTKLFISGLGQLISDIGRRNFSQASTQVAGPVGMVQISNEILSGGIGNVLPYLYFVGIISLTLSIMNILPIPALDGGRLFFLLIELVTRKRVHAGFERWVHTIGMAMLLILMVVITYSDIRRIFL